MRKIALFFILGLSLLFNSCKNEEEILINSIVGIWEIRSSGGYIFLPRTVYKSMNGGIMKFTSTEYQLFEQGQLLRSGKYKLRKVEYKIAVRKK
jgi:hypothetical protein